MYINFLLYVKIMYFVFETIMQILFEIKQLYTLYRTHALTFRVLKYNMPAESAKYTVTSRRKSYLIFFLVRGLKKINNGNFSVSQYQGFDVVISST